MKNYMKNNVFYSIGDIHNALYRNVKQKKVENE